VGSREGESARRPTQRHAIIVGAGLAGTLAAERLAAREWRVELIDSRPARSAAAVGLVRPIANVRDAVNARLSRCAFLYALQHYGGLERDGYALQWNPCGVLQVATDDDEARRFEAIVASQGYPASLLAYVDAKRAREIASRETRRGGWWFPRGALVSPDSLALASLARAGAWVERAMGRPVERIECEARSWRALDADGRVIAEAPVLVLANAADAKRLLPQARLSLSAVRGQVTYLPAGLRAPLEVIVSGSGYIAPLPDGGLCIGASYGHDDPDASVRIADHRENLERAEAMLPGFARGLDAAALTGWTGFRATVPDRLPIFGVTAVEGVHTATGLGSRGLLWGPLGAELLACQLEGEPLPLPSSLAGAVSPRRFLS
jgi:tRNA 5-methylaminomethyl-2-thiouridine biosynthesis bifunctional protein